MQNEPILSVLIPSRCNVIGLRKAIASVTQPGIEILLRYDEDDVATHVVAEPSNGLKAFKGPRHGYDFLWKYIVDLLPHAKGRWITMLDDDCTIESNMLIPQLETYPDCFAYCHNYKLNASHYVQNHTNEGTFYLPGWFLPWKAMIENFPTGTGGIDVQAFEIATKLNLPMMPLINTTYNHQRNETLSLNRP